MRSCPVGRNLGGRCRFVASIDQDGGDTGLFPDENSPEPFRGGSLRFAPSQLGKCAKRQHRPTTIKRENKTAAFVYS